MRDQTADRNAWCRCTGALLIAVLCLSGPAAYAHDLLADRDPANDWIEGLANSENVACCGNNDCYPVPAGHIEVTSKGEFRVEIGGSWFAVPESNLVRDKSPDGRPWVCPKQRPIASGFSYRVEGVRCLLLPMLM